MKRWRFVDKVYERLRHNIKDEFWRVVKKFFNGESLFDASKV